MLNAIVRISVRHRGIVIALATAFVLYGALVLTRTKYDVFPEFAPPQVSIQTEAPGLTSEQVEILVTRPIENAINGVQGIASVRSQSIQGLSAITTIFGEGTDIYRARQSVAERLAELSGALPQAARAPVITPLTSSTGTVLVLGLTSGSRSLRDLRTYADWTLRPELLAVPGVARVTVHGGDVRQLQIEVDPLRLRSYRLTMTDVVSAAQRATGVRGAGAISNANEQLSVRTEGQQATVGRLAQSVVRADGPAALRIGDIAHVIEGSEPRVGAATVNGQDAVQLVVDAQLGANVREVAAGVTHALDAMRPAIEAEQIKLHPALFQPSKFIDVALLNVEHSLLIGGSLVAVVLLLFLADFRAAAVSLTAIPLSLLAAIVVLDMLGLTINTLTLGGLAIAIGEVVDDAIIDVENIGRRLRENRSRAEPKPLSQVVFNASVEVRSSVVYATFLVALVFIPVVGLTGVQGAFFRPLGLAYLFAILASLLVALTVTPALAFVLLARRTGHGGDSPLVEWLKVRYTRQLSSLQQHPGTIIAASGILIVVAVVMVPFFGGSFLPEFNEGHLRLHMAAVPGTSLDESIRIGNAVTASLRLDKRVRSVAQRAGRAEAAEDTYGPYYSEMEVDLAPLSGAEAARFQTGLRRMVNTFPGAHFLIMPYLTERIEETLSGSTAPLVVKIFGDNLDSLDAATRTIDDLVRRVPDAVDVQSSSAAVSPEVLVRLKPQALTSAGVPALDALSAVETATQGERVAQVFEGNRATDVVVKINQGRLSRPEDLAQIPLATLGGRVIPLGEVADIARVTGRYSVAHEGARRIQTVTASAGSGDLAAFTSKVEKRLTGASLPGGIYTEVVGSATARREAQRELLLRGLLAGAGILVLLWLAFGNLRQLLLVLANLPFALVGGVFAVFVTGASVSLGSLVGFVTLFGITTRNAIMLIAHYDHLVRHEGETWGPAAAIRGATERLGPILMTAVITGLGLLPLAIGSGDPGREIEGPLAIVILGGLVTSTVLSLFVLPTLALRYGRFGELELDT
ncbi:MAG: efflux RND transporter permease subunit [Gemmatimonadaceae bacterium]|nr:efflux RND transporter permease subunit [Gemmatimonadaceae bacterium]